MNPLQCNVAFQRRHRHLIQSEGILCKPFGIWLNHGKPRPAQLVTGKMICFSLLSFDFLHKEHSFLLMNNFATCKYSRRHDCYTQSWCFRIKQTFDIRTVIFLWKILAWELRYVTPSCSFVLVTYRRKRNGKKIIEQMQNALKLSFFPVKRERSPKEQVDRRWAVGWIRWGMDVGMEAGVVGDRAIHPK